MGKSKALRARPSTRRLVASSASFSGGASGNWGLKMTPTCGSMKAPTPIHLCHRACG